MRATYAADCTFTYDPTPDEDRWAELFAQPLFWVYVGDRCVGTAEPGEDGQLVFFPLPLLWQDEGDQA